MEGNLRLKEPAAPSQRLKRSSLDSAPSRFDSLGQLSHSAPHGTTGRLRSIELTTIFDSMALRTRAITSLDLLAIRSAQIKSFVLIKSH